MTAITCTRRIQFCAGHRVLGHEGKCAHPHGHNYVAFITAETDDRVRSNELDSVGRVVDFSILKDEIGGWIDKHWDHGFIYFADDVKIAQLYSDANFFQGLKSFELTSNPTAENLARYLLRIVCPGRLEGSGVVVTEVTIWETENCYATAKWQK